MSVLEKFLETMKLNVEDEEYEDEYEEYEEEKPRRRFFRRDEEEDELDEAVGSNSYSSRSSVKAERPTPKITPMRSAKKSGTMEVCVIKPSSFEDAHEITETLLTGRTVILNLEGLGLDIAQRIIDFSCGSTFAISGNLQKVSNYIFIVTPPHVDISGDFLELVDNFDFSGLKPGF